MAELINKKNSFAARIIRFYNGLNPDFQLPAGIEILQPYAQLQVKPVIEHYYNRFYGDNQSKIFLFGINPGRLGGGITGIPFTDPVQLTRLGIQHEFDQKQELSSSFVYSFIEAYGGIELFAKDFFLTATCPIGFTTKGKNYNYYDNPSLESATSPWIVKSLHDQIAAGANRTIAVSIGEGSNFNYLKKVNQAEKLFDELIALPHPRWIMQYRRKSLPEFIDLYVQTLKRLRP
jgi:hypothetical protein